MKIFRKSGQAGFSLVELLVVVAIIAMLAAVGLPMYNKYKAKSAQQAAFSEAKKYIEAWNAAYSSDYTQFKLSGIEANFIVEPSNTNTACTTFNAVGMTGNADCYVSQQYKDSSFSTTTCTVGVKPAVSRGESSFSVHQLGSSSGATRANPQLCYDLIVSSTVAATATSELLRLTSGTTFTTALP